MLNCSTRKSLGITIAWQFAANSASALAVPMLMFVFSPGVEWRKLLESFLYSLLYANIIGTMACTIIPRLWDRLSGRRGTVRWFMTCAGLLGTAIAGCTIATLILLSVGVISKRTFEADYLMGLKFSILITMSFGIGSIIYESMRQRLQETTLELRTKELERERALKLATEARLSSLESRVHPHFLFNTLNSVSSLIRDDPNRAERLIERMAALLRFSLDSTQMGYVALEKEIKIVTDYLEIEKARFEGRLRYEIRIPAEFRSLELPPLTIQTLVENSVKYAIAPRRAGGVIRVMGRVESEHAHIEVSDDGPGFSIESAAPGHGLDNLQSRLLAVYGMDAGIAFSKADGGMTVTVSIPMHARSTA